MSRTIHVSLEGALRRPGYWRKIVTINGRIPTTDEFRSFLCAELRAGRTAIQLGCPAPLPDGTCPGHET